MATNNGRIGPWSSIDVAIEGELLAKDGLRKRREQLEAIVEPYVTTKRTADEILFQGKRRYLLKPLFRHGKRTFHAILALEHLYNIESAWKAGDIDKVIRATVGFATADHERQLMDRGDVGLDSMELWRFQIHTKRKHHKTTQLMRDAKASADRKRKRKNQVKAEQAIRAARDKFPSASFDDDSDVLEAEAAKIIGKSRRTLNRWLGGK